MVGWASIQQLIHFNTPLKLGQVTHIVYEINTSKTTQFWPNTEIEIDEKAPMLKNTHAKLVTHTYCIKKSKMS